MSAKNNELVTPRLGILSSQLRPINKQDIGRLGLPQSYKSQPSELGI